MRILPHQPSFLENGTGRLAGFYRCFLEFTTRLTRYGLGDPETLSSSCGEPAAHFDGSPQVKRKFQWQSTSSSLKELWENSYGRFWNQGRRRCEMTQTSMHPGSTLSCTAFSGQRPSDCIAGEPGLAICAHIGQRTKLAFESFESFEFDEICRRLLRFCHSQGRARFQRLAVRAPDYI